MEGVETSVGGTITKDIQTTPTKSKDRIAQPMNETPRARQGHVKKKMALPNDRDRPRAVPSRSTSPTHSNSSTGSKRNWEGDDDDFFGTPVGNWSDHMSSMNIRENEAKLQELMEDTITAVQEYTKSGATAGEGRLGERAQALAHELTVMMSGEKTISTDAMLHRVYNQQERMEKRMKQFERCQIELDRRERKSETRMLNEEVRTFKPIPNYAAVAATASIHRGGNTETPAMHYVTRPVRPAKATTQNIPPASTLKNPNRPYNPCRMVVRAPELLIDYERPKPEMVAIRVNEELAKHDETKEFVVVHVRFNVNNSCILNLRSDQRVADLEPHAHIFKQIVFPGHSEVEAYPDEKWFSVHICGVKTGIVDGSGIRTAEEVRQELIAKNPDIRGRTIRAFRWVRPEGKLIEEGKYASSVVVSFEKEEDARYMTMERRSVSLYWASCIVKEFTDKPPAIQCEGCQGFHRKAACKAAARCRLCAEDHHENEHAEKCSRCIQARGEALERGEMATVCMHRRCANCKDGEQANHAANDRMCPVQIRRLGDHRDPKPTHPVGNIGNANGGWRKVTRKRKGKKQTNPATEAGTESEADPPTSGRRYANNILSEKEIIATLQVVFPEIQSEQLQLSWKQRSNGSSLAQVIEDIRDPEQPRSSQ
ncbi:uncharacterized protein EV420DRAFT_1666744 [Desarmillaria tabescens]|uniref:Uncharacterized protein n=1 Tax=Armillaria tabescens TaxID=1929756 RepID=A0AA39MLD9_ARMTA|nr:uncharacterized protein EV420DRAFT_1666744 [Desarmillaria tabescens]KAK0437989.1 hypothetical protein EV420DRAFT_1666744 [Desarmillaria tabescens]